MALPDCTAPPGPPFEHGCASAARDPGEAGAAPRTVGRLPLSRVHEKRSRVTTSLPVAISSRTKFRTMSISPPASARRISLHEKIAGFCNHEFVVAVTGGCRVCREPCIRSWRRRRRGAHAVDPLLRAALPRRERRSGSPPGGYHGSSAVQRGLHDPGQSAEMLHSRGKVHIPRCVSYGLLGL